MKLSPAVTRRIEVAVGVFGAAFLSTFVAAPSGLSTDVFVAAVSAGVSAVAHWGAEQLHQVAEAPTVK